MDEITFLLVMKIAIAYTLVMIFTRIVGCIGFIIRKNKAKNIIKNFQGEISIEKFSPILYYALKNKQYSFINNEINKNIFVDSVMNLESKGMIEIESSDSKELKIRMKDDIDEDKCNREELLVLRLFAKVLDERSEITDIQIESHLKNNQLTLEWYKEEIRETLNRYLIDEGLVDEKEKILSAVSWLLLTAGIFAFKMYLYFVAISDQTYHNRWLVILFIVDMLNIFIINIHSKLHTPLNPKGIAFEKMIGNIEEKNNVTDVFEMRKKELLGKCFMEGATNIID